MPLGPLPRRAWLGGVAGALASILLGTDAEAKGKARVEWKNITVPEVAGQDRIARMVKSLLGKATKRADFGNSPRVVCVARMTELAWEDRGDIVRLSCTLVGRIEGGPSARSRISFGGRPSQRIQLEKQVLMMVTQGVVTRLAQIARTHA